MNAEDEVLFIWRSRGKTVSLRNCEKRVCMHVEMGVFLVPQFKGQLA